MKICKGWLQALLSPAARSRVLARLASLAQIGELVRRLIQEPMSHIEVIGFDSPQNNSKYLHFSKHVTSFAFTLSFHKGLSVSQSVTRTRLVRSIVLLTRLQGGDRSQHARTDISANFASFGDRFHRTQTFSEISQKRHYQNYSSACQI